MTLTPNFFDTLIIVIVLIGSALAAVRLYRDLSRPLPPDEDTRPNKPVQAQQQDEKHRHG